MTEKTDKEIYALYDMIWEKYIEARRDLSDALSDRSQSSGLKSYIISFFDNSNNTIQAVREEKARATFLQMKELLKNANKVVKKADGNDSLQTSSQWYQQDASVDILDPDGWRDTIPSEQEDYWYNKAITYKEYRTRREQCTVSSYNYYGHREPY